MYVLWPYGAPEKFHLCFMIGTTLAMSWHSDRHREEKFLDDGGPETSLRKLLVKLQTAFVWI